MIPARQPQQEYIITEAWVKDIYAAIKDMGYPQTAESTASMLRSRPHTSPPAPTHQIIHNPDEKERKECGDCEAESCSTVCIPWINEHDAQVAKAAREEVLGIMRPHVLYFALCMEEKLRKHDQDRGERGWVGYVSEEEVEYLFNRLKNEVEELLKEIKKNPLSKQFPESRDVGNFAMMIDTAHFSDAEINPMIRELMRSLRGTQEEQGVSDKTEVSTWQS
jgi:hypothetical protein